MARKSRLIFSLILLLICGNAWGYSYVDDANCQGAWLFTEGSGTILDDASQNNNPMTLSTPDWLAMSGTNAPAYATYMLDFVSANIDYAYNINTPVVDPTGAMTISCWVNPDTYTSAKAYVIHDYLSYKWLLYQYSDGSTYNRPIFYVVTTSGTSYTSTTGTNIGIGAWAHIAGVYDKTLGSARLKIYINGVQDSLADGFNEDVTNGTDNLFFAITPNAAIPTWEGKMFEVGYFDRATSSTEINDIMDNGLKPTTTSSPMNPRIMWINQ